MSEEDEDNLVTPNDNLVNKNEFIKCDKETAEKEYDRLVSNWKIKEPKDQTDISGSKDAVIEAIMDGIVRIDDSKGPGFKFSLVQKLDVKVGQHQELIYKFPLASDMMQMDNFKSEAQFKRSAAMIGSVTGIGNLVHKMGGIDFTLGQAVAFVFLGV